MPRPVVGGANTQWTLDFISDAFASGRSFRVRSIVDECTRERLALRADFSQPSTNIELHPGWYVADTRCCVGSTAPAGGAGPTDTTGADT